jgi:hypothetical protein
MRYFLCALLIVSVISLCDAGVTLQQIVKLSKLKTSDDVIIQLIQKEGLETMVASKDVIYLKEQGVSDRVISYLMKISSEKREKLPPQESESDYLSENLRTYYTTTKSGKKVKVVTNLDENGKRMGGELPPETEPPVAEQAYGSSEPKEVYVIVKSDESEKPRDYDVEYSQPVPNGGVPIYNTYPLYPGIYYPYYPFYPHKSFKHRSPQPAPQNSGSVVTTEGLRNLVRPRTVPTPRSIPGSSAGTRSVKR